MLAEYTVNYKKTHSQTLLPMLDAAVQMIQLKLDTIDAIAAASGPGSFTGLRIGSATAKGLGLALDKPIIGVPTTQAMAYNLFGAGGVVCPIMDARRNQVYTGLYSFEKEDEFPFRYRLITLLSGCAVSIDEIAQKCSETGREVIFLGDGVPVFEKRLGELLTVPYGFAPAHMNRQRAASFAFLALQYLKEGKCVAARDHAPVYLRMSQAERERNER